MTICTQCRKYQQCPAKPADTCKSFLASSPSSKEHFTPGPWYILVPKPRYGKRACHSIVDSGGEYVAKAVAVSVLRGISAVQRKERKANEHLIAAAPEMYEALSDAVEKYGKPGGPWNVPGEPGSWIEKAKAALNKARGKE